MVDGSPTETCIFNTMYVESSYLPAKRQAQDSVSLHQESATSQSASSVGKHCAKLQGMCSFAGEGLKALAGY